MERGKKIRVGLNWTWLGAVVESCVVGVGLHILHWKVRRMAIRGIFWDSDPRGAEYMT